jgi:protein TonB
VGIAAALALEGLILLLLLTLGQSYAGPGESGPALTTFDARSAPEVQAEEAEPEPSTPSESQPTTTEPTITEPVEAEEAPSPLPAPRLQPNTPVIIPVPRQQTPPAAVAPPARPRAVLGPVQGPPAGPQDRGGGAGADTETVGTAPDGSPLYAAAWYRRPYDDELSGYLSTAQGPGWGLIACKTAPEWRVEDCVALGESPQGSNIARSVLAASWQFKVRPPRVGGQSLVGSWVRIRIDYDMRPQ